MKQYLFYAFMSCFLLSCVAQSGSSNKKESTNLGSTDSTPLPDAPSFEDEQDIFWHTIDNSIEKTLLLNENNANVQYLKGATINTFLRSSLDGSTFNYDRTYCMVASFNDPLAKKNLRIRAIPEPIRNLTNATLEYVLRIDFSVANTSQAACDGSALQILTTADAASAVTDVDTAFSLLNLCPNCNGILTSTDISLYTTADPLTTEQRIAESSLSLGNIILRVNTQSTSLVDSPSCSNSACEAKGFDCCVDGQCVNDQQLRPNATLQSTYAVAMADFQRDPATFVNWPNVFFVCGKNPIDNGDDGDEPVTPTDPGLEANERLTRLKASYDCLEEGKKATPDFATNQVCAPTFDNAAFETIRTQVWRDCGCGADPLPTNPDDSPCADYGLELVYNSANTLVDVACVVPDSNEDKPFHDLSLSLSTRSSPHRFYRLDTGASVDDMTTLASTVAAEGESFQYGDNNTKTLPSCGSTGNCNFNMNSITGQFSVDLSQARPATVVNLDFDQTYIINTATGVYTPCLQCDPDAWFEEFSSFPSASTGGGLTGRSFTTNRSEFGNNLSFGNYEDTVFGRACFLPPTMIPHSHKPETSVVAQRQNRLTTQAAFFVNGYQRDWYGFNAGAVIGSFDGVSWFAIGSGNRRVRASSKKLFLAINAPYADLAAPGNVTVQVFADEGGGTLASNYDYNPAEDAIPNKGASCQRWHQCETDTDCITALGWEYQCNDINQFKSSLPRFDGSADEKVLEEFARANFSRLLVSGLPPGSRKRCVYRGAGALCKINYATLTPDSRQKLMTCAPNFHCASLDSASFNTEISREPKLLSSIRYGQEADVLGRPLNYANATGTLTPAIRTSIRHSAAYYSADVNDYGICRPGRRITAGTYQTQHADGDTQNRTDYISQVGVCDSTATGSTRTLACPQIEMEDNQATKKGDIIRSVNATNQLAQNSCGGEAAYLDGGSVTSTFATIERGAITGLGSLSIPVLAADGCKRRPGQVCHTDLDCSPNRLHAKLARSLGLSFFGGTEAEKEYWTEELICGQSAPKPNFGDTDYNDYDMSLNRCCREVGSDFTMYTEGDASTAANNPGLSVSTYPHNNPTASGRYSRYASAQAIDGNPNPVATTAPYAQSPIINQAAGRVPKAYQWKTFNDTGSNNCCGGGWVRKFDDGSTNWGRTSRLNINVEEFACLNYRTESYEAAFDGVNVNNWQQSYGNFCLSPIDGGCIQHAFTQDSSDIATPPVLTTTTTATLDTKPANSPFQSGSVRGMGGLNIHVPYEPVIYANPTQINTGGNNYFSYFRSKATYPAVSFYLPAYIGYDPVGGISNIVGSIVFAYYDENGNELFTTTPPNEAACNITTNPIIDLPTDRYCIESRNGYYIFHGHASTGHPTDWSYASVRITFNIQNGPNYVYTGSVTDSSKISMAPGSEIYYLSKLGRLELLGVPQIVYEPLFCTTNRNKLVDGIFDLNSATRDEFYNNSFSMDAANVAVNGRPLLAMYNENVTLPNTAQSSLYDSDGNGIVDISDPTHLWDVTPGAPHNYTLAQERFVYADKVALPQVFSSSEFRCCTKLGKKALTDQKCCSGNRDDEGLCKLPSRANLSVYFNKFISSEGMDSDLPEGGLEDADFIPETGEPKITSAVTQKLRQIGQAVCESGSARMGGSFGYYNPEPNSGAFVSREDPGEDGNLMYSIVDSFQDKDPQNQSGYDDFSRGFRWDHHVYCE